MALVRVVLSLAKKHAYIPRTVRYSAARWVNPVVTDGKSGKVVLEKSATTKILRKFLNLWTPDILVVS
jgi:hypothetical protein